MTSNKKVLGVALASLIATGGIVTPAFAGDRPKVGASYYVYVYEGYGPDAEQRIHARRLTAEDYDILAYVGSSCHRQRKAQEPNVVLDAMAEVATVVLGNVIGTFDGATRAFGDAIDAGKQATYSGESIAGTTTGNVFTSRTKGTRSEHYSCMYQMRGWAEQFDGKLVGVGIGQNARFLSGRPIKRSDLPAGPAQQPNATGSAPTSIPGS